MENNKMILPKFIKKESGYELKGCFFEYKKKFANQNDEVDALLTRLDEIAREEDRKYYCAIEERHNQWEKLLGKYLKVTVFSNGRSYEKFYLMPYRLVRVNNCLFGLTSHINNDYKGGITTETFNIIDGEVLTSELEIEEVTKEEMLNNALQQVNHVLELRIEKMNTPEQEHRTVWKA